MKTPGAQLPERSWRVTLARLVPRPKPLPRRVVGSLIMGALVVAAFWVLFSFLEAEDVTGVLQRSEPLRYSAAIVLAMASMAAMSLAFALFAKVLEIRVGLWSLTEVGYVTLSYGRLVAFTGVPGLYLRVVILSRFGAPVERVLAASFFHSVATQGILFLLVPASLMYILFVKSLQGWAAVGLIVAAVLFLVAILLWTAIVVLRGVRRVAMRWTRKAWLAVARRDLDANLQALDVALDRGTRLLRRHPRLLQLPLVLLVADWALAMACLWFCFWALGILVDPGVLLAAFAIGSWLGWISNLPGGLGVLEGSMTGTFVYLGVPLEEAALAAVGYRLAYYVLPYLLSLPSYWRLLRGETGKAPQVLRRAGEHG